MKSIELPVEGMGCTSCAERIEGALRQVPGVETAVVNFATAKATIEYDPERAQPQALIDTIDTARDLP